MFLAWLYPLLSRFTCFCLFFTFLVHFSHSVTLSTSPVTHRPSCLHPILLWCLDCFCRYLPLSYLRSLSFAVSFLFFCPSCFPPFLHHCDVLNLLRGSWRPSWLTTLRMKARLDKKTTRKAKYVLFSSWKYVSSYIRIFQYICWIKTQ